MNIAIVGGGWYGCHLALTLQKAGHNVTIYEKNADILLEVSGKFAIRLHKGPHYLRSEATRDSCHEAYDLFCKYYPDLIVELESSIYALGTTDAQGIQSRVNVEEFEKVCRESIDCEKIDLKDNEYDDLQSAMELHEPAMLVGEKLREYFRKKLSEAGIKTVFNYTVKDISSTEKESVITGKNDDKHYYDYTVNATGYQALLPPDLKKNFPVDMEVVYQPCIALKYQDTKPGKKPISMIVMDGWYPCLMPYVDSTPPKNQYILTHGSYTILGSCKTPQEAQEILNKLNPELVDKKIKEPAESQMARFWKSFKERFQYLGEYISAVLAKIKTKQEFRSSVVFKQNRTIYVVPGKISNVVNADPEVDALINDRDCITENGISYMKNGVLHQAKQEIATKPDPDEPNTCNLNTYAEMVAPEDKVQGKTEKPALELKEKTPYGKFFSSNANPLNKSPHSPTNANVNKQTSPTHNYQ